MKAILFSDWHLERGTDPAPLLRAIDDADVCIVPGDIDIGDRAIALLIENVAPRMPVVYVPGNHCYRGSNHDEVRQAMRARAELHPNLHLLDPGTVVLGDVRFVGTTLWTDFMLAGAAVMEDALAFASKRFGTATVGTGPAKRPWTPQESMRRHAEERAWLEGALAEPWPGTTIVVSHHAPHPGSVHARYLAQDLSRSCAYASDLSEMIERHAPDMWCHGHTHDSTDYMVGTTRVVANPHGYAVSIESANGVEIVNYATDVVVRDAGHDRTETYQGPENRGYVGPKILELPVSKATLVA